METYVSIIVPYFNRIHYLKELIESVHKYADMPYQLIVHDDASVDNSTPEVFNMRENMSTIITNIGHNLGLCASMNRLVKTSTSEYIVYLCDDCALVSNCLKDIVNIISKPYVGYLHLTGATSPELNLKDTKFQVSGIKSGSALAFRRSVFDEVGGWREDVFTGASDVTFMTSILKKGYFATVPYGKEYVDNLSYIRHRNTDSSICMSGYDCSYPKIFNLKEKTYDAWCKMREAECNVITNSYNNIPAGITNLGYWNEYINKLLYTKHGNTNVERIDWESGKPHNHDRWKDLVINDNMLI